MRKMFIVGLIALSTIVSMQANASLVSTDWKIAGDQLSTLDQSTGKEWLDLSLTLNMSYNEVLAKLSGDYLGWRLPTNEEISVMMGNNFGDLQYNSSGFANVGLDYIESVIFNQLFDGYNDTSVGFYVNEYGELTVAGVSGGRVFGYNYDQSLPQYYDGKHVSYATFLVSDGGTTISSQIDPSINTPVPEPLSFALLGLGAIGMFGRKRKGII